MKEYIKNSLLEAQTLLEQFISSPTSLDRIEKASEMIIETFAGGGRVFSCGNGGSMSDAIHFAEELSGRYRKERKGLPATAISDPGHISCVANDYGYDYVFSRYLEAHCREGDLLLAISTSGRSPNILNAAQTVAASGGHVIALTGRKNSLLGELADSDICVEGAEFADRTQEIHIKVIHILIEMVERHFFPENYAP